MVTIPAVIRNGGSDDFHVVEQLIIRRSHHRNYHIVQDIADRVQQARHGVFDDEGGGSGHDDSVWVVVCVAVGRAFAVEDVTGKEASSHP